MIWLCSVVRTNTAVGQICCRHHQGGQLSIERDYMTHRILKRLDAEAVRCRRSVGSSRMDWGSITRFEPYSTCQFWVVPWAPTAKRGGSLTIIIIILPRLDHRGGSVLLKRVWQTALESCGTLIAVLDEDVFNERSRQSHDSPCRISIQGNPTDYLSEPGWKLSI